jgi:hypothetical protein
MNEDDAMYKEHFNQIYLPYFTEYFSQSQMEKKIISYKFLLEELKKLELSSSDSSYKHVMSKKVLLTSKNAKNLCRAGIQLKHIKSVILKMFNVEYSDEDIPNKIKDVLKGRSFEDLADQCPTFTSKSLEESLPFHYLNEKGIKALKEVLWLLNGVLPKIEYSPMLLSVASLLLLFLSKEETYEVLRNIIESDQNVLELNKLRWHFRYSIIENFKLDLSIKTCILDLSKDNVANQLKLIEEMGCPMFDLIQDMTETFFLDYVNFLGIMKFLSFFLLEGIKGIYRLVYALISFCNLKDNPESTSTPTPVPNTAKRVSKKSVFLDTLKFKISRDSLIEVKPKEEVIKLFKDKSNKIEKFYLLIETATQWKLTHMNNNYMYQFIPPSIREKIPKFRNLIYIPSFTPESRIIKSREIPILWALIPSDIKYCNGILLFDKQKNPECNLNDLYAIGTKLEDNSKIFFLIQTTNDEIFGGFMEQNIKLSDNVKYLTPPQSFLFTLHPEMQVYEPINKTNDEVVCFEPGSIRYGYGRDGPAISINFDLTEGITEKNTVFGKDICLIKDYSDEGVFGIKGLEIYLMQ